MSEIKLRTASGDDAGALLKIYEYYVKNTAITFEWEVPTVEDFRGRIENTLKKYPYIVAVRDGEIVGYAYASAFKTRRAYDWDIETSIYVSKDCKRGGIGRMLLVRLEEILTKMGVTNANACITNPDIEDEYLTKDSIRFHEKMGYSMVGIFHKCGYKFNRWYNMCWMEKMIGEHKENQKEIIPFPELNLD